MLHLLVHPLGLFQPLFDQIHVVLRRLILLFGLFLKAVENIDPFFEFNSINGPISTAVMVLYDFEHTRTSEAVQRFSVCVFRS